MMDQASLRQHTASTPSRSTWLSANAGSGKTKSLGRVGNDFEGSSAT